MKHFEKKKKKFWFRIKKFRLDTDTEIGPWFRFPIPNTSSMRFLRSHSLASNSLPLLCTEILTKGEKVFEGGYYLRKYGIQFRGIYL